MGSLPEGLSETDYETIEAAVTETVRGRWFLSEFARRNRSGEMRQLLDAIGRLETNVVSNQPALPSADPSVRLLIQRIKEIAGQLSSLAGEMRLAGLDERFVAAVDLQAKAVAGMMRNTQPSLPPRPAAPAPLPQDLRPAPETTQMPSLPKAAPFPPVPEPRPEPVDPRLALLSGLDGLPLPEKLALFA